MTNGEEGFDLIQEIVRSIAQEYRWPDFHPVEHTLATVQPHSLKEYVGCYKTSSGALVTVTQKAEHFFARTSDGEPWEIFPDSKTHFFSKTADVQITFKRDDRGRATGMVLREYGEDTEAKRVF